MLVGTGPAALRSFRRRSKAKNTVAPVLSGTTTLSLSTGTWTGSTGTYERRYLKNGVIIPGATAATYNATNQTGTFVGQVRTFDTITSAPTGWKSSNEIVLGDADTWAWEDGDAMAWEDGELIQLEAA